MRKSFLFVIAFLTSLVIETSVQAAVVCANRESILRQLEKKYKEVLHGFGKIDNKNDQYVELFMKKDGKSWTLLSTDHNNKQSCVIATGKDWKFPHPKILGEDI